jgi:hypothetical protein
MEYVEKQNEKGIRHLVITRSEVQYKMIEKGRRKREEAADTVRDSCKG